MQLPTQRHRLPTDIALFVHGIGKATRAAQRANIARPPTDKDDRPCRRWRPTAGRIAVPGNGPDAVEIGGGGKQARTAQGAEIGEYAAGIEEGMRLEAQRAGRGIAHDPLAPDTVGPAHRAAGQGAQHLGQRGQERGDFVLLPGGIGYRRDAHNEALGANRRGEPLAQINHRIGDRGLGARAPGDETPRDEPESLHRDAPWYEAPQGEEGTQYSTKEGPKSVLCAAKLVWAQKTR